MMDLLAQILLAIALGWLAWRLVRDDDGETIVIITTLHMKDILYDAQI